MNSIVRELHLNKPVIKTKGKGSMDSIHGQQLADPCSTLHMQSPVISYNILYYFRSYIQFFDTLEMQVV